MRQSPKRFDSHKARRSRNRNRANRLRAQSMLEEYFEPDFHDVLRTRHIPIRSRRHFVPTASGAEVTADPNQLTFDLEMDGSQSCPDSCPTDALSVQAGASAPNEGFKRLGTSFGEQFLKANSDQFSMARFLTGCAMGSAAAIVILMLVNTALG